MSKPNERFVEGVLNVMDFIAGVENGCGFSDVESSIKINLAICDDVAQDVWDTADRKNWCDDDVRLAVGRVLRKRLGISE